MYIKIFKIFVYDFLRVNYLKLLILYNIIVIKNKYK